MARVTGIGGVFFKARDPEALRAWYKRHLKVDVQAWGGAAFNRIVPARAAADALHIAIAAMHGMEYLLTWNCRHIANAQMRARIEAYVRACGIEPPILCTPEELMETPE